jgi:hypothetical protein
VCCGSEKIDNILCNGVDKSYKNINLYTHHAICSLLNKPDPMGLDWTILAVLLGLQDYLPQIDDKIHHKNNCNITEMLLSEWCEQQSGKRSTIRQLISKIKDLGRLDVYELILNTIKLFEIDANLDSGIQNSNLTSTSPK